jgi:hypothetical protein
LLRKLPGYEAKCHLMKQFQLNGNGAKSTCKVDS